MASKEVMIVTPEDIKNHIALSAAAADTLKWMIANAGVEMVHKNKQMGPTLHDQSRDLCMINYLISA